MAYSSVYESWRPRRTQASADERIEPILNLFKGYGLDLYVLYVPATTGNKKIRDHSVQRQLRLEGGICYVVTGREKDVHRVADKVYKQSQTPLGCAKIDTTQPILWGWIAIQLHAAYEQAKQYQERLHFYDPERDSLEQRLLH